MSICMLLVIIAQFDLELEQMNVKISFLHGELEERIYMKQPECYIQKGKENKVCFLRSPSMDLNSFPGNGTDGSNLS